MHRGCPFGADRNTGELCTKAITGCSTRMKRAWRTTESLATEGSHDVVVLRKGTRAAALGGAVDGAQLFCQKWIKLLSEERVSSSQATASRSGKVPTTTKIITTAPVGGCARHQRK